MSSNKVQIIPSEKQDFPFFVKWGNRGLLKNEKVSKRKVNGLEQKIYIETSGLSDKTDLFTITVGEGKSSNKIGFCEVLEKDFINHSCFVNIHVDTNNNKLFSLALELVLEYIFYKVGLYKVSVDLLLSQKRELKVFREKNFNTELRKRDHAFINGKYETVLELSILKTEFGALT